MTTTKQHTDTSQPSTNTQNIRTWIGSDFWSRFGVPIAWLVMAIFFTTQTDVFLTEDNIINILRQSSIVAIAAVGATFVLIVGGIDISQGAIMALAAITTVAGVQDFGIPDELSIIIALLFAGIVGLANGFFAEVIKIPAFIATLGMAFVVRGIGFVYTEGRSIGFGRGESLSGEIVQDIGKGFLGSIPIPVIVMIVLYIVASIVMRRFTWGMHTYAIGSAERAAQIAGLRVRLHRIQVYTMAGMLSGLAGIVLAGRLGSASPGLANGAEFDVLTAVVLGGTSIYGGRGNVERTLIGALFLTTLTNGLILLNVPTFYQQITVGAVLLSALTLDRLQSR